VVLVISDGGIINWQGSGWTLSDLNGSLPLDISAGESLFFLCTREVSCPCVWAGILIEGLLSPNPSCYKISIVGNDSKAQCPELKLMDCKRAIMLSQIHALALSGDFNGS
jgi:hypothetical protein